MHMRMHDKELLNLPVYTQANEFVGHVVGFDVDIEQHCITHYLVGKHKIVENILQPILGSNPLRIASTQVRSITSERMTVDDASVAVNEVAIEPGMTMDIADATS